MNSERPQLTEKAKESLDEHGLRVRNTIYNIAEKRALDQGRGEISEDDILQAKRRIPIFLSTSKRKWCIRVLFPLTFAFLFAQIAASYQLFTYVEATELPLIVQLGIVFPMFIILLFMVIFTLLFRDDWS